MMNTYRIVTDRNKEILEKKGNTIYMPFAPNGILSHDLLLPAKHTHCGYLKPIAQDLIDLATMIFHADKLCKRGEREEWVRTIEFNIELRCADKFKKIEHKLIECLSILGSDNFKFSFNTGQYVTREVVPKKVVKKWMGLTDISLFSGGQDSFIGASKLLSEGNNPLFLHVFTHDKAPAAELIKILSKHHKRKMLPYFNQTITSLTASDKNEKIEVEPTQRLRSFYFLTIASILAEAHSLHNVYINENGIMAIHLPLDPARVSSFSTKTAYPPFLKLFEEIVTELLEHKIRIINPFVLKSKAEVIKYSIDLGVKDFMSHTVSCAHSATIERSANKNKAKNYLIDHTAHQNHCGYCFPCILRRISMWAAGLEASDVKYTFNPFEVLVDGDADKFDFSYEAMSAILGLIRMTKKIESSDDFDLQFEYPQLIDATSGLDNISVAKVIYFHRHFARQVHGYINKKAKYLDFLFDDQLSAELAQRINNLVTEQNIYELLSKNGVKEINDKFYPKFFTMYQFYRLILQVSLATKNINEEGVKKMMSDVIHEVIAKNHPQVKVTSKDVKKLKEGLWEKLRKNNCPPLWEAKQ